MHDQHTGSSGHSELQPVLASVLFTDVSGFSRRMQTDELGTLRLLERDFRRFRDVCSDNGGRVLKSTGDGLVMVFPTAAQAVRCALEMQQAISDAGSLLPADQVLHHRIGIHLGDVYLSDSDVMGDGVNIAARIMDQAEPGGICFSQTVYDVVRNRLEIKATYLGPCELKNIREAIPIYQILIEQLAGREIPPRPDLKLPRRNQRHPRWLLPGAIATAAIVGLVAWLTLGPIIRHRSAKSGSPTVAGGHPQGSTGAMQAGRASGDVVGELASPKVTIWQIAPAIATMPALQPGQAMSLTSLVAHPAVLPGVQTWTVETVSHRGPILSIAYSPDGRFLATGGQDATVRLWDATTLALQSVLIGHTDAVMSLAWTSDGKELISTGLGPELLVWNIQTGQAKPLAAGLDRTLKRIALSGDGQALAVSQWSGKCMLVDLATGKQLWTKDEPGSFAAWHPRGESVLFGLVSGAVVVCDRRTGKELWRATAGTRYVYSANWSPDSSIVVCSTLEEWLVILDAATGAEKRRITGSRYGDTRWSPDGAKAASAAASEIVIYDAGLEGVLARHKRESGVGAIADVSWSADGGKLAWVSRLDGWAGATGKVHVCEVSTGQQVGLLASRARQVGQCTWHRDTTLIAMTAWLEGTRGDAELRLAHGRTGQIINVARGGFREPTGLAFSPDGRSLAMGRAATAEHSELAIRDLRDGKALRTAVMGPDGGQAAFVAWSPQGKYLATGARHSGGILRVWDAATLKQSGPESPVPSITAMQWSPVNNHLASASQLTGEGTVRSAAGEVVSPLGVDANPPFYGLDWSTDGAFLAGCGYRTFVWNTADWKPVFSTDPTDSRRIVWSPRGEKLAILDNSGFIRLRDGRHYGQIGYFPALEWQPAELLEWWDDGRLLVTVDGIGVMRLWDAAGGTPQGTALLSLPDLECLVVSPLGHFRASPETEAEIRYVVQTDRGRELIDGAAMRQRYGWTNDPAAGRLTTHD